VLIGERRVLVGGGFAEIDDGAGQTRREPVASVELLNVDLAEVTRAPIELRPAALDRAFVALGAGSALAVGGCTREPIEDTCQPCGDGGCVSRHVWWIDALGVARRLADLEPGLSAPEPHLVAGAQGSPWLLAAGRLARFDPWQARFVPQSLPPDTPAPDSAAPVSLGPGLFAWLTASGELRATGYYHDSRSTFTQDVAPLLVGSGRGLLPHRPPTGADDDGTRLSYSTDGGLQLSGSQAVASIAETRYADLTLELTLSGGPAPLIRLVDPDEDAAPGETFGGLECPWPSFEPPLADVTGDRAQLSVRRSGNRTWLSLQDAEPTEACERTLPERVLVQLIGPPTGVSQLTRIEIRRSLE
jgi:hypothetical protein